MTKRTYFIEEKLTNGEFVTIVYESAHRKNTWAHTLDLMDATDGKADIDWAWDYNKDTATFAYIMNKKNMEEQCFGEHTIIDTTKGDAEQVEEPVQETENKTDNTAKRNAYIETQFNNLYNNEDYGDMGEADTYNAIIEDAKTASPVPTTYGDVHTIALRIWEITSCHTVEEIEQTVYDILSTAHRMYPDEVTVEEVTFVEQPTQAVAIDDETKTKLFEQVLKLEHLAEAKTYDNRDYGEQSNGAFSMLEILGLHREYINWAVGR